MKLKIKEAVSKVLKSHADPDHYRDSASLEGLILLKTDSERDPERSPDPESSSG